MRPAALKLAPHHSSPRGPGPLPPRRLREVVFKLEGVTTPASKLNLVARLIRHLPVEKARAQLHFSPKAVSKDVLLALNKAVDMAASMHQLKEPDLIVGEAFVGGRIITKMPDFKGRGRTGVMTKKQSDLTLKLYEHPKLVDGFKSSTFEHLMAEPKVKTSRPPLTAKGLAGRWDEVWQKARLPRTAEVKST